ncbi:MAG: hypothetical protein WCG98_05690 [bacterium]
MKLESNKSAKSLFSFTFCLAFLMFGASTFAGYASLPEESFSPVATVSSETSAGDKSLADFGEVL